jgi:hypothetical protein
MKKLTAHELDYIYSVLSEKLDKCICDGFVGFEHEIADLHLCLAKLATLMKTKNF